MSERRFGIAASVVAALLLIFAGTKIWRSTSSARSQHTRAVTVAWRCEAGDGGTCRAMSEVERCTSCHEVSRHPRRALLVERHEAIGCVACHGGDGLASEHGAAHRGLARLGAGQDVPEVQARCAACHDDTRAARPSPAKGAWASWLATRAAAENPSSGASAPSAAASSRPTEATPDADAHAANADAHAPNPATQDAELAPSLAEGRALFRAMRCGACHAASDASPPATPLTVLGLRSAPGELARALREHAASGHVDLGLDEVAAVAVSTHLGAIAAPDASTAMVHRASVPGSSAEDGKTLYERLACGACHDPTAKRAGRLAIDLAPVATSRTPDWVAYYLADPTHANPAATMPSLRLTVREAASLAAHLVDKHADTSQGGKIVSRSELVACKVPGGESKSMARDACGEAVVAAAKCASCHTAKEMSPTGPSLARFGDDHDGPSALAKLVDHAGFRFDPPTRRDLATYLLAQRSVRVRPDLRAPRHPGEHAFGALGCAGCHALDEVAANAPGPSLFGEGLRTQPQWLFGFLLAPQRHPVRPALHPELAFRDLVAPDHVAVRMPTFALGESGATSLVRFFSERDGASFPYAASEHVALAGDALTGALGDLERKDRGNCVACHTVGAPDVARARDEGAKLAPPLALAHERLRPAWIEACIAEPNLWVHGMPPFARPIEEIDRLRGLVLLLRDRTVLPPPGEEGAVPALGLGELP